MDWIFIMNRMVVIVVPCIVAFRKIFLYRIPGRTWMLLWEILIFRLLCPFTLKLQFKNMDVSSNAAGIFRLQEKIGLPGGHMLLSSADEIMKIIWLIGAIAIAGAFIRSHLVNRKLYCMALPVKGVYFEEWKKSHSLKRKVEIRKSDRIAGPLTYGFIKPVILLPAHTLSDDSLPTPAGACIAGCPSDCGPRPIRYRNMEERSLELVLEHEFIHIKHLDVLLKWILVLICSVYWYNPLIWVMYFFVDRDMELSCDEALLKNQTPEYKKEYLRLLISFEEKKTKRESLCSSFCKYPIEERIRVMVKTEKENSKSILISLLIVCLITILNLGITTKAEAVYSYDAPETDAINCNEESGDVPNVIGMDLESASETLRKHGFSYYEESDDVPNVIGMDLENASETLRKHRFLYHRINLK